MELCELLTQITLLPWRWAQMDNDKIIPTVRVFGRSKHGREICCGRFDRAPDAHYACHAANVLPELVEALGLLLEDQKRPRSELSRGQFEFCVSTLAKAKTIEL